MAVAKTRKGKVYENRTKEGQRKVGGQELGLQVEQTALLASPVCIGQAPEEGKTYKQRSQRALSPSVSPPRARALLHSLLFSSLGWHALTL